MILTTLQWKQDARNAWLSIAADQVRQFRAEDAANGITWADQQDREATGGKAHPSRSNLFGDEG